MMNLLDRYMEEVKLDLEIHQMNVKEVQMRLPARKHFWVSRLIKHKIDLQKLQQKKQSEKEKLVKEALQQDLIKVKSSTAESIVEKSSAIVAITQKIKDEEIIIEFLEKVEKIFSTMHWEIKNIVELQKLELT